MTEIRLLTPDDLADDAVLRSYYDLAQRAELEGREDAPFWSYEEFAGALRSPDSGMDRWFYLATEDGRPVAGALLETWPHDNLDKAYVEIVVDPPARRRGLGRAMGELVERRVREEGRTTLLSRALTPPGRQTTQEGVRFAEALGFAIDNVEVVRHLALPVADTELRAWRDEAAPASAGYTIETHVDTLPDELLPSLAVLMGQLVVDAPTGSVEFEEREYPVERFAERQAAVAAMGRSLYETLALTPDRQVVAHSTLVAPLETTGGAGSTDVFQWGTFVHREHRGHRLGLATKAVNLAAVQRDHPGVRCVITQNAETNDQMVAINERMGFEIVELCVELVKRW